jgi:hypothetical protein
MADEKIVNTGGSPPRAGDQNERLGSKSHIDPVSHVEMGGDDLKGDHVDYNRIDSEVAKVRRILKRPYHT